LKEEELLKATDDLLTAQDRKIRKYEEALIERERLLRKAEANLAAEKKKTKKLQKQKQDLFAKEQAKEPNEQAKEQAQEQDPKIHKLLRSIGLTHIEELVDLLERNNTEKEALLRKEEEELSKLQEEKDAMVKQLEAEGALDEKIQRNLQEMREMKSDITHGTDLLAEKHKLFEEEKAEFERKKSVSESASRGLEVELKEELDRKQKELDQVIAIYEQDSNKYKNKIKWLLFLVLILLIVIISVIVIYFKRRKGTQALHGKLEYDRLTLIYSNLWELSKELSTLTHLLVTKKINKEQLKTLRDTCEQFLLTKEKITEVYKTDPQHEEKSVSRCLDEMERDCVFIRDLIQNDNNYQDNVDKKKKELHKLLNGLQNKQKIFLDLIKTAK